jgi:hypothetical protein
MRFSGKLLLSNFETRNPAEGNRSGSGLGLSACPPLICERNVRRKSGLGAALVRTQHPVQKPKSVAIRSVLGAALQRSILAEPRSIRGPCEGRVSVGSFGRLGHCSWPRFTRQAGASDHLGSSCLSDYASRPLGDAVADSQQSLLHPVAKVVNDDAKSSTTVTIGETPPTLWISSQVRLVVGKRFPRSAW